VAAQRSGRVGVVTELSAGTVALGPGLSWHQSRQKAADQADAQPLQSLPARKTVSQIARQFPGQSVEVEGWLLVKGWLLEAPPQGLPPLQPSRQACGYPSDLLGHRSWPLVVPRWGSDRLTSAASFP
jgi:hypothetical protein